MSFKTVRIAVGLGLAFAVFGRGTAGAQGLYPRSYAFSCSGSLCTSAACTASVPVAAVGRIQLNSPVSGNGSAAVNSAFGNNIIPSAATPFTVAITNGTAAANSSGGNAIPVGCFSAKFKIANITFLSNTFACYSDTEHDFDLIPLVKGAGATLSCHAKEM